MIQENELIKSEIKGRLITYYLTTKEDLINVKSSNLLGDIFAIFTSLSIGGLISVIITKATGIQLEQETLKVLDILLYVFVSIAIIFGFFTGFFYVKSYKVIDTIKESGEVKSLNNLNKDENSKNKTKGEIVPKKKTAILELIKATYWTPDKKLDVSKELRSLIKNNKLEVVASNKIKGDPEYGIVKKLTIEYIYDGIKITKEYEEGDKVIIP